MSYAENMSNLQVRNVPDDVLRLLKVRAAAAGQSLSEYVLGQISLGAAQPTIAELTNRIQLQGRVEPETRAADLVAEARLSNGS